ASLSESVFGSVISEFSMALPAGWAGVAAAVVGCGAGGVVRALAVTPDAAEVSADRTAKKPPVATPARTRTPSVANRARLLFWGWISMGAKGCCRYGPPWSPLAGGGSSPWLAPAGRGAGPCWGGAPVACCRAAGFCGGWVLSGAPGLACGDGTRGMLVGGGIGTPWITLPGGCSAG